MKYLFFDIECANCFDNIGKICEFGYVLCNERFEVTDRKLFIIDPKSQFDWYVSKNMLAFTPEEYKKAPDYKAYFDRIKALIEDGDTMIFGHTTDADIKYLNDEARRYGLPFFDCKFYDAKYMYDTYAVTPNGSVGVSGICEKLGIEPPKREHKSDDDAYATMQIVKEICRRTGLSAEKFVEGCEDCRGETKGGVIKTAVGEKIRLKREEMEKTYGAPIKNNKMLGENKDMFIRFLEIVRPRGALISDALSGKKLCISTNYEHSHFKEMLSIVQLLKDRDCTYCMRSTEADVFVTYSPDDGTKVKHCARMKYVEEALKNGADITVMDLVELLRILGTTEEELLKMPFPNKEELLAWRKQCKTERGKRSAPRSYSEGSGNSTLGDIMKASGIDPEKLFKNK